jgi:hypothetical protein
MRHPPHDAVDWISAQSQNTSFLKLRLKCIDRSNAGNLKRGKWHHGYACELFQSSGSDERLSTVKTPDRRQLRCNGLFNYFDFSKDRSDFSPIGRASS